MIEWPQLRYHDTQTRLWRSRARFRAVCAGRGSGKTEISRRRVIRWLPVRKPWHDPIYFYALPTREQAKRIAWLPLKNLCPRSWIRDISESELSISTVFGSKLYLLGMDKPSRAEGVQWDGGVVDESSDQKPGVFDLTLRPALSHRNGWCDRIGVPKRAGVGAQSFKEFFLRGISGSDSEIESFAWPSSDIMTAEEIESAKKQLDPRDFNEQYNANWETVGGLVHYGFSDIFNVDDSLCYNSDLPLLIGSDFNVDPMAWVIGQVHGEELHVFDELFMRNCNTMSALQALSDKYKEHRAGMRFYGDATGRARKTAASESDYIQIKNFPFIDSQIHYPLSNPAVHDRVASVNAMFCNAKQVRRLKIHPRCRNLKQDLITRSYKQNSNEFDDYGDIGHITDALGYLVYTLFPIRVESFGDIPVMNM